MNTKKKNAIYRFIMQDVKSESETKEMAVMIRCLDLIFGFYFIGVSVSIACLEHYILSLFIIFAIGLLTGSFFCTYDNKTQAAVVIFIAVVTATTSYLTLVVGYNKNYHWLACLCILVVFFNLKQSLQFQVRFALGSSVFFALVTVYSTFHPVLRKENLQVTVFIIVLNLIVLFLSISLIAFFYRAKFMLSEEKIIQYNKKLIKMASVDALTSLYNRRHMNDYLKDLAVTAAKNNRNFCIAIGDVDLFKSVNDTYGHDTGDYVLVTLSEIFRDFMNGKGTVARWGGEEFLFVLETDELNTAYLYLEQLRKRIHSSDFSFKDHNFHISMTFGVEEYDEHKGVEMTISLADSKLYIGKQEGRNQVVR